MDMRNLIFRAKRVLDNKWITGTLVNIGGYVGISEHGDCYEEVRLHTLSQWCGATDIKGLMIFEGDYIKASKTKSDKPVMWQVEWRSDGFVAIPDKLVDGKEEEGIPVRKLYDVKVIGNKTEGVI